MSGTTENCVIYVCTTVGTLALWHLGAGGYSLLMLLMLLFVNTGVRKP
jgi:hypothetical protein